MSAPDFTELIKRQEELDAELAPYLNEADMGWQVVQHPLVFAVPYMRGMNAYYNEQLRQKKIALERALQERNWGSYIYLHERPYRIHAFLDLIVEMEDDEYWKNLGDIWSDSENLWQMRAIIPTLLNSKRPGKENLMSLQEREFYKTLPEEFIIYRGHQTINRSGWSWSLSHLTARWFARRLTEEGNAHVAVAICQKKDIHAVVLSRNEFEVIVDPEKLKIREMPRLKRPAFLTKLLDHAKANFVLNLNRGLSLHGPEHWEKVEKNAIELCKITPGSDELVCRMFAILHDFRREDENRDPQHGRRAAAWIEQDDSIKNKLTSEQFKKLLYAVARHNDGEIHDDPTIGICWDADRLDLPRVGVAPDPKRLSTEAARSLIWRV